MIDVLDTGPNPLLTTLHEFGHHMAEHLDPADVERVAEIARTSSAATLIRDNFPNPDDYLLSTDELWARAYAQFIAEFTGEAEVVTELQNILNNPARQHRQWHRRDWTPIYEAVKIALKRKGFL